MKEVKIMNKTLKGLLVALIMLYVVSPVDAVPGPVDDLLVTLLGFIGTRALENTSRKY